MRTIIFACAIGFILSACGKGQEPAKQSGEAMEKAPAQEMEPSVNMMAIDHTRDEKEFVLKRSLWGVEAMIEDYKKNGYDTTDLENQKAELENKLNALM